MTCDSSDLSRHLTVAQTAATFEHPGLGGVLLQPCPIAALLAAAAADRDSA